MNIANIKKELSGDEKVLERAFKLETMYKKYKVFIWILVIAIIVFFVGKTIMQEMHEKNLAEANTAFITLQSKADDAQALSILQEKNPALFELFSYAQASKNSDAKALSTLASSNNAVIADASAYTAAALENKNIDSELYREMALLQEAYLSIKSGDNKVAKSKLELIDEGSPLYMLASLLKHSTLKAK